MLDEVRGWVERWDERVRAQLARRPSAWQSEHGRVVTNAGLERKLAHIHEWLEPRRNVLRNRERLNRVLMLMQLAPQRPGQRDAVRWPHPRLA